MEYALVDAPDKLVFSTSPQGKTVDMVITEGSFRLVNGVCCRLYILLCKSAGYNKATLQQMRHELLPNFLA